MANINVNRNVMDPFYRYKMPRIIAKVEGKGNGIKTVIVNMSDVAKALSRPPTYTTKYFGCELGAQTQFDVKNDRYIVNGSHDAAKLQDLLDGFIKRFILCPACDNPETNLNVLHKKGMISQRCIACGHTGNIDMRHKLTTYILKNPPDQDPATAGTPSKKAKKLRNKGKNETNGEQDGTENGHDEGESPPEDGFDDEEWGEDTSEEAIQKRMEDLTDAAKSLALDKDLEKTQQERVDLFYSFIKEKKDSGKLDDPEASKEILAEAERLDIKDKGPLILAELLFDENILSQVKKYRKHFLRFTHENPKAQKYLLGGFELLVGKVYRDTLMSKVPNILKAFYDLDILDEEVIIDWDTKVSKKYVSKEVAKEIHEKAKPVIIWLKEAEEESSEEEEEEVEVVYSHTEKAGLHKVIEKPKGDEEEDDDLDIDNI